jgi:hypothetical protein
MEVQQAQVGGVILAQSRPVRQCLNGTINSLSLDVVLSRNPSGPRTAKEALQALP